MIDEIYDIAYDLYEQQSTSQKTNSFLHLYEFLLFIQVFLLIKLNKYHRALFELNKMQGIINEYNKLLFHTLKGICLSHSYYYDLALMEFSEAISICKPLIDEYKNDPEKSNLKKKEEKNIVNKNKTPEGKLIFIYLKMSFLIYFLIICLKI